MYVYEPENRCKNTQAKEWRSLGKGNSWDVNYTGQLLEDIQNAKIDDETVKNIRVLLVGPVCSGKSSFMNTVTMIDRERIAYEYSFPHKRIMSYKTRGRLKNFELFESSVPKDLKDIKYVVNGNVPPDIFNCVPIVEESKYFRKNPQKQDKIHCIVLVIEADRVKQYSETHETIKGIKDLQEVLTSIGVPKIVLLTKIDRLCERIESDITHCYKCEHVMKAVHHVVELIEIPECNVCPVQNYSEGVETSPQSEILPLLALRQMIFMGMAYLKCLQFDVTDTKLEETSVSNSSKESYNNQELDKLNKQDIPKNETEGHSEDGSPEDDETETLIDYTNFHQFNGILF